MDIDKLYEAFLECGSVCTDTRKITPGCLFFALRGEKFDANTFVRQALEGGARYAVIDDPQHEIPGRTFCFPDSLAALQQLASHHRKAVGLPIVALTGSNGKTTTKELIHAVLSRKYKTGATLGNLNNHIGVPLTILSFTSETEIGIVEMGANHQREIAFLCEIATPDFGYITNFGKAHLEGFGGVEGVIKGKSELYDYLDAARATAFVNLDDPIQDIRTSEIARFTFSAQREADVMISEVSADPMVALRYDGLEVRSNLIGSYNAPNIAAAIAIGTYFKVPAPDVRLAIEQYNPNNNRSQLLSKGSNQIIMDAYNANPSSMAAAIENLRGLDAKHKVAILGDMFELGEESFQEHRAIVETASRDGGTRYIFAGPHFAQHRDVSPASEFFANFDQLSAYLSSHKIEHATLLIKGSRGMALERILDFI